MPVLSNRLAGLLLLAFATVTPCVADSLASSASSAGSASVGSLSDSLRGSSNSSAGNGQVAEGDYRIVEVVAQAGRPGLLTLKMQADDRPGDAGELWLDLPREALARRTLAAGDTVRATRRPYGFEFAHADTREAFFLALADEWRRELDPRVVAF